MYQSVAQSLTPRETSHGLQHPAANLARRPSSPPAVPSQDMLRQQMRRLRERRLQKESGFHKYFDPAGKTIGEPLSRAIRSRTAVTVKTVNAGPATGDVMIARERELEAQRQEVNELTRTYDRLHTELVAKDEVRRALEIELQLAKNGRVLGAPPPPLAAIVAAADAAAAAEGQTASGASSPTTLPPVPGTADSTSSSQPGPSRAEATERTQLRRLQEKVRVATEQLNEMVDHNAVLGHIEGRTVSKRLAAARRVDQMKHRCKKLDKEAEALREVGEEASGTIRAISSQVNKAHAALVEQRMQYEEAKSNRERLAAEDDAREYEKSKHRKSLHQAKLEGMGDLDREGER